MVDYTFLDTNIILPSEVFALYKRLNQYVDNRLTFNSTIEEKDSLGRIIIIDEVTTAAKKRIKLLESTDHPTITGGVKHQVLERIKKITENIDDRKSNYIFSVINPKTTPEIKTRNEAIYNDLITCKTTISDIAEIINKQQLQYQSPESRGYLLINDFINDLNTAGISANNTGYEHNTDRYLVVSSLFESLYNKKNVNIVSNDQGLLRVFAATSKAIGAWSATTRNENFKYFSAHLPKAYQLNNQSTLEQINIEDKSNEAYGKIGQLTPTEQGYYQALGTITNIIEANIDKIEQDLNSRKN